MTYNERLRFTLNAAFLITQFVLLLGLYAKGYTDFMRSVAVTNVLWIAYSYLEYKYRFYMDNTVRALVLVILTTDGFVGYYLAYYIHSFVFDKVQHFAGTYAFSLFAYILAVQLTPVKVHGRVFTALLITALGAMLGVLYEIAEFLVDQFAHPIIVGQGGLLDTDLDLICDVLGGLLAGLQVAYTGFLNNLQQKYGK